MTDDRRTRRRLLAGIGAGFGALAGCAGVETGPSDDPESPDGDATPNPTGTETRSTVSAPTLAEQGRPQDICEAEVLPDSRQAIVDPAFATDWSIVDEETDAVPGPGRLTDDDAVVGMVDGDRARAYPIAAFWKYEAVDDDFGGPLLVTFCPICNSGMVASRVVDGETLTFDVSGQLWVPPRVYTRAAEEDGDVWAAERRDVAEDASVINSGNLVLYDLETGSFWSQLIATAICGEHRGTELTIRPSTLTTWREWREAHPDTDVLLPPPHSGLL